MRFRLAPPSNRTAEEPTVASTLVNDWASRVTELADVALDPANELEAPAGDFESACLVRDQLDNQLDLTHVDEAATTARSMKTLRSADSLFRRITVQSNTASTLSVHNHYARLSQWWWRRRLRRQK